MILLLGDIHGNAGILKKAAEIAAEAGATAVIQLGDFGLFYDNEEWFRENIKDSNVPIYFIDGNHDDCRKWIQYDSVHRVWDDRELYYIPRGTVMELDGRIIAAMGGASSIDKKYRLEQNMQWDPNEDISEEEISRMLTNAKDKKIDMFLTHCPPGTVIDKHFDPLWKLHFGVAVDWVDPNQMIIEKLWHELGTPYVYSGHMHKKIQGMSYRILDINEVLAV